MPSDPTGDAVIVRTASESSADLRRRLRSSSGRVIARRRRSGLRTSPAKAPGHSVPLQHPISAPSGHCQHCATVAPSSSFHCAFIFCLPCFFVIKLHICLAFLLICILVLLLFIIHLISYVDLMKLHEKFKKSVNCMLIFLQYFSSVFCLSSGPLTFYYCILVLQ